MENPGKPVRINERVHHKLKLVCVNFEVKMEDLATAIIETALKDEEKLNAIVKTLNPPQTPHRRDR